MKTSRALAIILAAILTGSFVASCSRTPPVASATPTELIVQLNWFADGEHAYLYYGEKLGIFAKHGFALKIRGGKGSELSAKLVATGDADLALVAPDAVLAMRDQGAEIYSIGVLYDHTPVVIYSLADKNITQFEDLYGKTLGVLLGSNTYIQYEGLCKSLAIDRSRITERAVNGAIAPNLLLAGELDALMYYTHHAPVKARQVGHDVNEIHFKELGVDMYGMTFAISSRLMERSDIAALQEALRSSIEATKKEPKKALEAMSDQVELKDLDYELGKLQRVLEMVYAGVPESRSLLGQAQERWTKTAETCVELGVIKSTEPAAQVVWPNRP